MEKKENQKSLKIIFLEKTLRFMARAVLKKYKPKIVGITGSVGKSSSKEAIFSVLTEHFNVRKNEKNYNNEIGLPLSIIGSLAGGRSVGKWLKVLTRWIGIIVFPVKYPEILILEMGADRPGDIKYLTEFIKCQIAVVTDISGSHLEYFKTLNGIAKEKLSLVENISSDGSVAVNIDNPYIFKFCNHPKNKEKKFVTFGFSPEAEARATDIFYNYNGQGTEGIKGLSFKLNHKGTTIPVRLNGVLARHSIYAALSAISVGIVLGINLVEIAKSLENFSLPPGRMTLISGIKNSFIIDDTYNASPVSTLAAFQAFKEIKATRKIAVLGDMLELGLDTEEGHKKVAQEFLDIKGDIFFAVGQRMKMGAFGVFSQEENQEKIFFFSDVFSAGKKLQEIIRPGDLILVKGSQGMRMEKVVEEIMMEPMKASKLLCRQEIAWKKIPVKKV